MPPRGGGGGRTPSPTAGARNAGLGAGVAAAGGAGAAAATGGSATAVHETLMAVATPLVSAAVILPPALMISFQFRLATGKPQNLEKAAAEWEAAANELQQAAEDLQNLVKGIPQTAWDMDDRGAYESKVNDYILQLEALQQYLSAVSTALTVLAYALLVYSIFAMGMAVYITALLALAVAALASVVGAPSYAGLVSAANVGNMITIGATGILAATGAITGGVMYAKAGSTADAQAALGNTGAQAAYDEAFANGVKGSLANLGQNAVNGGLAFINRSDGVRVNGHGGRGFPLRSIDLDVDRDINETTTYGAGAKVGWGQHEAEVGGNIKHNDQGWAGGEIGGSYKYSDPSGQLAAGSLGGKVTWDENENVGGGFKGGVENPRTGSKGEYEGNWEPNGDYHDKYNVQSPVFNREGSLAEKESAPKDETPPWDK